MGEIILKLFRTDFVPSLTFITMFLIFIGPVLPGTVGKKIGADFDLIGQTGIVILGGTIILGFLLSNMDITLLRFFRGNLLNKVGFLRNRQIKKALKIKRELTRLQTALDNYRRKSKMGDPEAQLLIRKIRESKVRYEISYPSENISATDFGNIWTAMESYPLRRYGIDSDIIWTRLQEVFPMSYENKINRSYEKLLFLVNSSFLSFVFALICLITSIYEFYLYYLAIQGLGSFFFFIHVDHLQKNTYNQLGVLYVVLCLVSIIIGWLFYKFSIANLFAYAQSINSAYDLFRMDLLNRLHLKLPENSEDEMDYWWRICDFLKLGDSRDYISMELEYVHGQIEGNKGSYEETEE